MITEQAIVKRCRDGHIEVELQRQSACDHCELSQGCGTGALGRLIGRRNKNLLIETDARLQPGDRIEIGMPETALVSASLLVYGLPLIGLLVAALIATAMALPELGIVVAAGIGFAAGYRLAKWLTRRLVSTPFIPHIVKIEVNPLSVSGS